MVRVPSQALTLIAWNAFCTAIYLKVCVLTLYLDISRKDKYKLPCIFGDAINLKSCIYLVAKPVYCHNSIVLHRYLTSITCYYLLLLHFIPLLFRFMYLCVNMCPLFWPKICNFNQKSLYKSCRFWAKKVMEKVVDFGPKKLWKKL